MNSKTGQQKLPNIKNKDWKSKKSLRDLLDYNEQGNINGIRAPEGEKKESRAKTNVF